MGNKRNKKRKLSAMSHRKSYENRAKRKRLPIESSHSDPHNRTDDANNIRIPIESHSDPHNRTDDVNNIGLPTESHSDSNNRTDDVNNVEIPIESHSDPHNRTDDLNNIGSMHCALSQHPYENVASPLFTHKNPVSNEEEEEQLPFTIETENETEEYQDPVIGRRILDIHYFLKNLSKIASHNSLFDCKLENLILVGEKRVGLFSKYKFTCNFCNESFFINSEDPTSTDRVEVNTAAVTGIVSTGIGYAQFQELTSALDIPVFAEKYYAKLQDSVFEEWEKSAVEAMETAAEKEKEAAIKEGRLKDGYPLVDVYVDGCWCTRSYGDNYRALSGAAVIIGRKFGEVLYIGVKNKYCTVCARAEKKAIDPKEHTCYKNFDGSSSSMESEIICEGFKQSLEMYGLIYARLIADGDSSTYSKILAANPYPNHVVEKIECRNHVLRNTCKKLRAITKDLKYPLTHRKLLTDKKVMTIRKAIVLSIKYNKQQDNKIEATRKLHADISNSALHAFGDHQQCKNYYCDKVGTVQSSAVAEIQRALMWFRIKVIVANVASKSRSLVEDVDTNCVERFNSVVAKFVGGKRINFAMRRSYQSRCSAAVVSYNTRRPLTTLHKNILGKSPESCIKKLESKRDKIRKRAILVPRKKNRSKYKTSSKPQNDYGSQSSAPDMSAVDLELAKDKFLQNLEILVADRTGVERATVLQRDSSEWVELRKNLLTASNFGRVVKRKTKHENLVRDILYKKNISHVASIAHGIDNEKLALEQLANQENIKIEPCGLFIHEVHPFLGASPDGLVGRDTIVEVKCPIAPSKVGMDEAIKANKVQLYKYNKRTGEVTIDHNSNWYYQVQGQLSISGRKKCIFGIWGSEREPLIVIEIEKDEMFWKDKMERKLVEFYNNHILPELVDSRYNRGMPIRDGENKENKDTSNTPRH